MRKQMKMKFSPNRPKPTLLLESRLGCIWSGLLLSAALLIGGPVSAGAQGNPSSPPPPAVNQAKIEKAPSSSKTRVMTPFGPMDFTLSTPPASAQPAPAEQQPVPKKPPFPIPAQQPQAPQPQQQPAEPAKPAPPPAAAEPHRQTTRTASSARPGSSGTGATAQFAKSAGSPVVTAAQSSADQATPSKFGPAPSGKEWVSTPFGPMLLDKKKQ